MTLTEMIQEVNLEELDEFADAWRRHEIQRNHLFPMELSYFIKTYQKCSHCKEIIEESEMNLKSGVCHYCEGEK